MTKAGKNWRKPNSPPTPTPRTPRAAESIAERIGRAGRTLLLLATREDRRKMFSWVKIDKSRGKLAQTKLTPSFYPAPPARPNPPPGALSMPRGERTKYVVSCKIWQKRKTYLAQRPNKTCFPSSHAVSGVHGKTLGGRGRQYGRHNTATVSRHFGRRGGEEVRWAWKAGLVTGDGERLDYHDWLLLVLRRWTLRSCAHRDNILFL